MQIGLKYKQKTAIKLQLKENQAFDTVQSSHKGAYYHLP